MATQTTPAPAQVEVSKQVFDLSEKDFVTLVKRGTPTPVTSVEEFTTRLGNDAGKILEVINAGMLEYEKEILAANSDPWMVAEENEEGEPTENLIPYNGTPVNESKWKSLQPTIIAFAKAVFGYAKNMVPGDVEKNREAKKAAKKQALDALLSNPATVELLKAE